MGEEAFQIVRLKDDFYRDGFRKVLMSLGLTIAAIILIIAAAFYLFLTVPPPVKFATDNEWRVLPAIPLNERYLSDADVKQWASGTLQQVFDFDFINYNRQLESYRPYFTENGWQIFRDLLNNYAAWDFVNNTKSFVNGAAAAAPEIINSGIDPDTKRYVWILMMKMKVSYESAIKNSPSLEPVLRVVVVRVPTLNNINGVAIDNIMLASRSTNRGAQ